MTAVALMTTVAVSTGTILIAGPASAGAGMACVQYDGTGGTTPVSTTDNPVPIAAAGSLAAGQSARATFTAFDSSGACVANGPIELLMGGPGAADPSTAANCSPLGQNGSLGANQTTCTTDSNGTVSVVFTTPTPLPSDGMTTIYSYGPGSTKETGTSYAYAIIVEGTNATAVEGQNFHGPVAYFTANGSASYTATVSWGDNASNSYNLGTPPAGATEEVIADHIFAEENPNDVVTATVSSSTGQQAKTSSAMNVTDAPLSAAGGATLSGRARTATSFQLGTFTDAAPEDLGSYTTTINWGDGTSPATGGVYTLSGSNGSNGYGFDGTHTYKKPGSYSVSVTITDDGGAATTTTDTARIR